MKKGNEISSEELLSILGGIAHDYNNINEVILGNITLAQSYIDPNHDIYECLSAAEKGVQQAKKLSNSLLTYTKDSKNYEPVFLFKTIRETTEYLLQNSPVKPDYNLPKKELIIYGVEVEITQIIRNIILNAEQSMPDGGSIRISVTEVFLSDDNPYLLSSRKYAKLTFEDEGGGIPIESFSKIFDKYCTTKNNGHGLGLAICRSMVKRHNGHIKVSSEKGKGSKFEIFLPIDLV